MNKIFKKFIKEIKEVKLSDSEKSILRSKISEFISFNPIRDNVSMPKSKNYISIFTIQHFVKGVALMLVITIVAGGSGVSYAASSSLPGEKLYNIKVNVNEKIEESLAITPEAKAAVQSKKVERRLEETQTLVKENKLNETSKKIVEEKLAEHIEELSEEIENLKETGDIDAVLETTAKLTPVLEAHKNKLLEAEITETDTLLEKVETTIKTVEDKENEIISEVEDLQETETKEIIIDEEAGVTNTEQTADSKAPSTVGKVEEKALKESEEKLDNISDKISSLVESRIESAENKLSAIKKDIQSVNSDIAMLEDATDKNIANDIKTEDGVKNDETEKEDNLPSQDDVDNIEAIQITEEESIENTTNEEVLNDATKSDGNIIIPEFNVKNLVKDVDVLLEEANALWKKGKFRSALEKAQEANRLISEIEIRTKMQELEIAKVIKESQKAEIIEVIR